MMINRYDDFMKVDIRHGGDGDLECQIIAMAKSLQFDLWWFSLIVPIPVTSPRMHLLGQFPASWKEHAANGFRPYDNPLVRKANSASTPIVWASDDQIDNLSFWDDMTLQGARHGWAKPIRTSAFGTSILSLARNDPPVSHSELRTCERTCSWFSYVVHESMLSFLETQAGLGVKNILSVREREVMLWTAEGKTAFEIALILSIAESTVIFHINNAVKKTHSSNKTQAAVKVMLQDLF